VTGGLEDLETHAGEVKRVAVFHGDEGVLGDGAAAEMDGGAAAIAELEVSGDEVGVEVREENVADLEAEFFGVVEILLDVALGVDDYGGVAGFVAEEVRGVGEAAEVVLFQDHVCSQRLVYSMPFDERRAAVDGGGDIAVIRSLVTRLALAV
jgi:hypothetical protein